MKRFKPYTKWLIGVIFIVFLLPSLKDSVYFLPYMGFWSVLLFVYIFINWFIQKTKIRKLVKENLKAELAMLKSQVNPHFFFNTLNNLYGLSVEKSDDAPSIILKLSDVMRYTIYEGEKERVLLSSEIKCLEDYIELNRIRHKKLDVTFEHAQIDNNIKIAPLTFLILLENAFKHGVEKLAKGAYIKLKLIATDDHITFIIENNHDPSGPAEAGGIGLNNLGKRLMLLYPEKHNLKITNETDVFKARLDIEI